MCSLTRSSQPFVKLPFLTLFLGVLNSLFFWGGFNKKILFSVFDDWLVENLTLIQAVIS